jgi:hypothetical protein
MQEPTGYAWCPLCGTNWFAEDHEALCAAKLGAMELRGIENYAGAGTLRRLTPAILRELCEASIKLRRT